jgi:hypothetical protein
MMPDELERLADWYRDQCDGDWEHQNCVTLTTLDNPGWRLDVQLTDTAMAGRVVAPTNVERGEEDWIFYEVKDDRFRGRCGPRNLVEMVRAFLDLSNTSDS